MITEETTIDMKIYANSDDVSIKSFIGRDVWVRCNVRIYNNDHDVYARFLRFHDGLSVSVGGKSYEPITKVYINVIPAECINDVHDNFYGDIRRYSSEVHDVRIDDIEILHPLDVRKTSDISAFKESVNNDRSIFYEIVDTDMWVRAMKSNGNEYFIHVLSIDDDFMEYEVADAYYIDHLDQCIDTFGPPSENDIFRTRSYSYIDAWDVCQPLDVMSDEEMDEAIEIADKYWWDNYEEEDYDDEDYE